ncbi:MAG: phosphatase PAP2-related protein [Bacteroidia bacterium]|nr:phosphatase PAP2-related protein [Bacteroidia bacterium]
MNHNYISKSRLFLYVSEIFRPLIPLVKSRYLYIGILSVIAGAGLNFASETYLHNYMSEGKTLPMLSDLILDNLPFVDVSLIYDIFCLIPILLVLIYFIHKKDYNRIPFFLLMSGIFYIVRGIFIVLTPFGNPPMFNGSDPLFNGFSKYELGVYPSGHAGNVFLMFLLVKDKGYKWLIFVCMVVVVTALFLARGHYSIDILSGLFFAYAIRAFGEKHLSMFDIGKRKEPEKLIITRQSSD